MGCKLGLVEYRGCKNAFNQVAEGRSRYLAILVKWIKRYDGINLIEWTGARVRYEDAQIDTKNHMVGPSVGSSDHNKYCLFDQATSGRMCGHPRLFSFRDVSLHPRQSIGDLSQCGYYLPCVCSQLAGPSSGEELKVS